MTGARRVPLPEAASGFPERDPDDDPLPRCPETDDVLWGEIFAALPPGRLRLALIERSWCVIGRRGGKSRDIAALLGYLATMVDYRAQLVLGERGVVLCLARTQEQSQVVLEYVAGIIDAGEEGRPSRPTV